MRTARSLAAVFIALALAACGESPTAPIAECQYDGSCIRWTQPDWNAADTARARYEGQRQGAGDASR